MNITGKRIRELEKAERKLLALEAGGVDSWEGYSESLAEYIAENAIEEEIDNAIYDLEVVFGEHAFEPSERGAGIAFNDNLYENAHKIIHGLLNKIGQIKSK